MKYSITIKNKRTHNYTTILVPIYIPTGTTIKWGSDENNTDGLAQWEVIDCVEQ